MHPPLNFTGVKKCEILAPFLTPVAFDTLYSFEMEQIIIVQILTVQILTIQISTGNRGQPVSGQNAPSSKRSQSKRPRFLTKTSLVVKTSPSQNVSESKLVMFVSLNPVLDDD